MAKPDAFIGSDGLDALSRCLNYNIYMWAPDQKTGYFWKTPQPNAETRDLLIWREGTHARWLKGTAVHASTNIGTQMRRF